MEIKVKVKSECKYLGTSYSVVSINEDDIRRLAEKMVADSARLKESTKFTAQEMIIENNA